MTRGLSKAVEKLRSIITRNDTAFDTVVADSTSNRIDASGAYTFNIGRHFFLENGTFINDIADTTALEDFEGKMQVTASAGDEHLFGARELVRYVPNYELLFGAAAWAEQTLSEGQHYAVEFGDDTFANGWRFHYEGTADGVTLTLEQASGGVIVDDVDGNLAYREQHGFDHTTPNVCRGFVNWYGAGLGRYRLSHTVRNNEGDISDQKNPTIARTANSADVATQNPNLRVQVRVWAESGAADVTVNLCSIGALIRGNATQRNREKPSVFYFADADQSISQYPTDNVDDALAARIDPERNNVAVEAQPPIFRPGGTATTIELSIYAIHKDHPDLTVNFNDPDDDGVDEGPSPSAQAKEQTDVLQFTRDVTSIPTTTDIRADGSEGLVPDMRHITTTMGESGGRTSAGASSAGELAGVKRGVFKDDVVILLPRSDPNSNTSDGWIRWMKPLFEQDW